MKGKVANAAIPGITDEQTDERIHIPQGVKLEQGKPSMCQAQQKRRDAQMPAVIEQWKKTTIQSTQRADAQHHVQKQECSGSKRADQQRLCRRAWVPPRADTDKDGEVECEQRYERQIVHLLLPVPTDRAILNTHGNFSTLAVSNTV